MYHQHNIATIYTLSHSRFAAFPSFPFFYHIFFFSQLHPHLCLISLSSSWLSLFLSFSFPYSRIHSPISSLVSLSLLVSTSRVRWFSHKGTCLVSTRSLQKQLADTHSPSHNTYNIRSRRGETFSDFLLAFVLKVKKCNSLRFGETLLCAKLNPVI